MFKTLFTGILLLGGMMTASATELENTLQQALLNKGPDYLPRTQHLDSTGQAIYTNRLILQDSPYLNQHAHNPVNWYPWGPEAFDAAQKENKAIFLSIGYSTCHWCHVMEEESFDNLAIAELMNQHFINIKVDREQRPDIDETYMTAVSLLTGRGGWPMSSFITQQGKTFWGGTYIPPEQFKSLLVGIAQEWDQNRDKVEQQADSVTAAVQRYATIKSQGGQIDTAVIDNAVKTILGGHDPALGGFTPPPKFPNEPDLFLLLDQLKRNESQEILEAVTTTLDAMAHGGIYDQIGGGFHRYATDHHWLVPHFEKMLYNQAHLARVYLLAYELTQDDDYARVAQQTLDYVLREMTSKEGGFYSATDADSEGEEGTFFVWTLTEIKALLSEDDAALAIDLYDISKGGNFEGKNILHLPLSIADYAKNNQLEQTALLANVDNIIKQLYDHRLTRISPLRDNKVITAWNGMLSTTLALASQILSEDSYLEAAIRNINFIWQNRQAAGEKLHRVSMHGHSSIDATQEDYAYYAEALLALYDHTQDDVWLNRGQIITDEMLSLFWDAETGGFFMNAESDVPVMARLKQSNDGAIPSGNSVALNVLVKLAQRTDKFEYEAKANAILATFSEKIITSPAAYGYMLLGASNLLAGETTAQQYAAKGAVSILAELNDDELLLSLTIKEGWHINAHQPKDEDLIPTKVSLANNKTWQIEEVIYPKAIEKRLNFSQQTLALYEGESQIKMTVLAKEDNKAAFIPVELELQACNEHVCLAPEVIRFKLIK
ncbi:MAG: thioredoxin [Gammaproteobacteria bacterium]|nr:MAG: thioredoxin [Gammaproteobacteria bacterium]